MLRGSTHHRYHSATSCEFVACTPAGRRLRARRPSGHNAQSVPMYHSIAAAAEAVASRNMAFSRRPTSLSGLQDEATARGAIAVAASERACQFSRGNFLHAPSKFAGIFEAMMVAGHERLRRAERGARACRMCKRAPIFCASHDANNCTKTWECSKEACRLVINTAFVDKAVFSRSTPMSQTLLACADTLGAAAYVCALASSGGGTRHLSQVNRLLLLAFAWASANGSEEPFNQWGLNSTRTASAFARAFSQHVDEHGMRLAETLARDVPVQPRNRLECTPSQPLRDVHSLEPLYPHLRNFIAVELGIPGLTSFAPYRLIPSLPSFPLRQVLQSKRRRLLLDVGSNVSSKYEE